MRVILASGVCAIAILAAGGSKAACVVTGSGTPDALASGDSVLCTAGTLQKIRATTKANVAVTIGDGVNAATLAGGPDIPILFNTGTTNSSVTVKNLAVVNHGASAIFINASSQNTISVEAGGLVTAFISGASGLDLGFGSNNNIIDVAGTISGTGNGRGLTIGAASTGNIVTVAPTGAITASGQIALSTFMAGASSETEIHNNGLIESSFSLAIQGGAGQDRVFNTGTIKGVGAAIDLGSGNDSLEMSSTSGIHGTVNGGADFDTMVLIGPTSIDFDLAQLGTAYTGFENFRYSVTDDSIAAFTGATAYSGAIRIVSPGGAGTVALNASFLGEMWVSSGTLMGTGSMAKLFVSDRVAPGNSIGTLTVTGDAKFFDSAVLAAEIAPDGTSDLISVSGAAVIDGGTVTISATAPGGYDANTQYTLLTAAGGVSGTFSSLTFVPGPLVSGLLTYDANNVYFQLLQVLGFDGQGATPNQESVADALDSANGNATPELQSAINILAAKSVAAIQAGMDDLGGQVIADFERGALLQEAGFRRFVHDDAAATHSHKSGRRVWGGAFGTQHDTNSTPETHQFSGESIGGAAGIDWSDADHTVGVAAGYSEGDFDGDRRSFTGIPGDVIGGGNAANNGGETARSRMAHFGVYGLKKLGDVDVKATAALGLGALDWEREIAFLKQTAQGEADVRVAGVLAEASRRFDLGGVFVSPYARAEWIGFWRRPFQETGAPGVNLMALDDSESLLRGEAGLRLDGATSIDGVLVRFGGYAGALVESGDAPSGVFAFEGAGLPGFSTTGAPADDLALGFGAHAEAVLDGTLSIRISYDGLFGDSNDTQMLKAVFRKSL